MAAAARRYGWILLVLGILALPLPSIPHHIFAQSQPQPFLSSVTRQMLSGRVLPEAGIALPPAAAESSTTRTEVSAALATPATTTPRASSATVVVREGQSLWDIASANQTTVEAIVEANSLRSAGLIHPGQTLVVPVGTAPSKPAATAARAKRPQRLAGRRMMTVVLYEGQTLWDLSQAYGASIEEIVAANNLQDADFVRAGQRLVVPAKASAMMPRRIAAAMAVPAQAVESVASSAVRLAQAFIWPARGHLTSGFGWRRFRHHDGIDIAAPYGSPVTAARDGVVVFSGWYYAYGKAIIIDHGNGLQTIYGHASKLLVREGQQVTKGQLIARVGSTGRSTGPHLHFEVRINGRAVNPIKYL